MSNIPLDTSHSIQSLYSWLQTNGFDLPRCPLRVADFPQDQGGRGMVAIRPIEAGDVVLHIPYGFIVTEDVACRTIRMCHPDVEGDSLQHLSRKQLMALWLVTMKQKNNATSPQSVQWYDPYVQSLPSEDPTRAEPPATKPQWQEWKRQRDAAIQATEYTTSDIVQTLCQGSWEEYHKARGIVLSRGFDCSGVSIGLGGRPMWCMLPYADMFNHSEDGI
eukprot:PhF_6_TR37898/c0_g1_i2/m.56584